MKFFIKIIKITITIIYLNAKQINFLQNNLLFRATNAIYLK